MLNKQLYINYRFLQQSIIISFEKLIERANDL
jgi:hypothetical protein